MGTLTYHSWYLVRYNLTISVHTLSSFQPSFLHYFCQWLRGIIDIVSESFLEQSSLFKHYY